VRPMGSPEELELEAASGALARLARDQRRSHHLARDSHPVQLPLQVVAARTRLVASLKLPRGLAAELLDQAPQGARLMSYLPLQGLRTPRNK
jgi:hypothetical protein